MASSASRRPGDRLKRLIDVGVASMALALFSPVLVLVALAVRLSIGSPVLFRQLRPGRGGVPFELIKFRSMREGTGTDAERLTSLGRVLRSTSLDELPELWNILRGDMSLVGPRPLLMEYLPLYSERQGRRHEVRPGLTGLAQVSGRNLVTWDDRFELDVRYVETRSLALDLQILARTIGAVARRQGVTSGDSATMHRFTGASGPSAPAVGSQQ